MQAGILSKLFSKQRSPGLGTIKGVFIPNMIQMVGVILFMRLGWIVGHVGIHNMSAIIAISSLLLLITSFSMTSIVSNMRMGGGGAYYLISRMLGVEFGSAIGLLLCLAQHASIALCVTGFSVSVQGLIPHLPIELIEVVVICSLVLISYLSTDFALKTQMLVFVALVSSPFSMIRPLYKT